MDFKELLIYGVALLLIVGVLYFFVFPVQAQNTLNGLFLYGQNQATTSERFYSADDQTRTGARYFEETVSQPETVRYYADGALIDPATLGAQGPPGPIGATGPQGPAGPGGIGADTNTETAGFTNNAGVWLNDFNAVGDLFVDFIKDSGLVTAVSISNRSLSDFSGVSSINWGVRLLVDALGVNSVDYGNRFLLSGTGSRLGRGEPVASWSDIFTLNADMDANNYNIVNVNGLDVQGEVNLFQDAPLQFGITYPNNYMIGVNSGGLDLELQQFPDSVKGNFLIDTNIIVDAEVKANCFILGDNNKICSKTDLSSGGTWGSITGTLGNQTDLNNALNLKENKSDLNADVNAFVKTFPHNSLAGLQGGGIAANEYYHLPQRDYNYLHDQNFGAIELVARNLYVDSVTGTDNAACGDTNLLPCKTLQYTANKIKPLVAANVAIIARGIFNDGLPEDIPTVLLEKTCYNGAYVILQADDWITEAYDTRSVINGAATNYVQYASKGKLGDVNGGWNRDGNGWVSILNTVATDANSQVRAITSTVALADGNVRLYVSPNWTVIPTVGNKMSVIGRARFQFIEQGIALQMQGAGNYDVRGFLWENFNGAGEFGSGLKCWKGAYCFGLANFAVNNWEGFSLNAGEYGYFLPSRTTIFKSGGFAVSSFGMLGDYLTIVQNTGYAGVFSPPYGYAVGSEFAGVANLLSNNSLVWGGAYSVRLQNNSFASITGMRGSNGSSGGIVADSGSKVVTNGTVIQTVTRNDFDTINFNTTTHGSLALIMAASYSCNTGCVNHGLACSSATTLAGVASTCASTTLSRLCACD